MKIEGGDRPVNGKLIEILSGLKASEMKEFGTFLRSPYFNKSTRLEKFYLLLKSLHGSGKLNTVTKSEIARKIYPGVELSTRLDSNIRKLISNLTGLAEDFVIIRNLKKNEHLRHSILLKESASRNYQKSFDRYYKETTRSLESVTVRNAEYYYFVMDSEQVYFQARSGQLVAPEDQLGKISFALDLYYISIKLLHFYSILNLKLHYKKHIDFDNWAFDEITNFVEKHNELISREHNSLYADYLSVKMMLNPDDSRKFEELKKYVAKYRKKFGDIEKHRMYIYLYNHSLYRFNKGCSNDANELFAMIREMEKENVPLWHYFAYHMYIINAVKYASMLGEFDWAKEFLNSRIGKVHSDMRDGTYNLAMANYHFYRMEHDDALRHLLNVDFPNYTFYLAAKSIMLKIYFENGETECALSQIDAARHFLSRKDIIPERHVAQFGNFVACIARLISAGKNQGDHELHRAIEADVSASDRLWFRGLQERL